MQCNTYVLVFKAHQNIIVSANTKSRNIIFFSSVPSTQYSKLFVYGTSIKKNQPKNLSSLKANKLIKIHTIPCIFCTDASI